MCVSREDPVCPHCGQTLRYRDRRTRIWKWYGGVRRTIQVRRMRCTRCDRLHTELPDILTPNRHYGSEVIENVVDEVSTPEDLSTENYPCEKTMQRWKDWIAINQDQIEGTLRSVGTRLLELHESLLMSTDSLLTKLRDLGQGWLSILCRIIYGSGGCLLRQKPPGTIAPDLSGSAYPP